MLRCGLVLKRQRLLLFSINNKSSKVKSKCYIIFWFIVNVIIYSDSLSSADDPLMIVQLMIERRRSTGGAGAENPPGGSNTYSLWFNIWCLEMKLMLRCGLVLKNSSLLLFSIIMLMLWYIMHCQAQMIHNSSIDDRARKLYWWSGRRKSTGGTGAEDTLVERARKIHWWSGHRKSTWWIKHI